MLKIQLKRVSPTQHAFTLLLENGGKETLQLETKTYLFHDLLHFAVESEAGITNSFYGRLAKGERYEELTLPEMSVVSHGSDSEALMTERIVGVLTGVLKRNASGSQALLGLQNLLSASGETVPQWFTPTFVEQVKERMRKLEGEWKGIAFGETMTIEFF